MSEQFAHELLKRSVARTCVALNYKETTVENLDCLADVVANFIATLGQKSAECAEHAGRARPGIQDLLSISGHMGKYSWKDLKDFGFQDIQSAASTKDNGESGSIASGGLSGIDSRRSRISDIVKQKWNQPFLFDVVPFPIKSVRRSSRIAAATSKKVDEKSSTKETDKANAAVVAKRRHLGVPDHCVQFPPEHTYARTTSSSRGSSVHPGKRNIDDAGGEIDVVTRKRRISAVVANQSSLQKIESVAQA